MVNFAPACLVDRTRKVAKAAFFPPYCRSCGEPGDHGLDLCAACREILPWNTDGCPHCALPGSRGRSCRPCATAAPAFEQAIIPLRYELPVEQWIHAFKFHGMLADGRLLGDLLRGAVLRQAPDPLPEVLVPLPLHPRRLAERGFDQNRELARRLRLTPGGMPALRPLLRRVRPTPPQAGLERALRARNVHGAFRAVVRHGPPPRHVALLDDVVTTGATVRAAAAALRAAGVRRIDLWAIARTAEA